MVLKMWYLPFICLKKIKNGVSGEIRNKQAETKHGRTVGPINATAPGFRGVQVMTSHQLSIDSDSVSYTEKYKKCIIFLLQRRAWRGGIWRNQKRDTRTVERVQWVTEEVDVWEYDTSWWIGGNATGKKFDFIVLTYCIC